MGLKILAAIYFSVIAIAIVSIAIDIFSPGTGLRFPIGGQYGTLETAVEVLPFVLYFLGIILIFYALKYYPSPHAAGPSSHTTEPSSNTTEPSFHATGSSSHATEHRPSPSSVKQAHLPTRSPGEDLPSTNVESEINFVIDDVDLDRTEQEEQLSEITVGDFKHPSDIDPITNARVLASTGRNFQAIDLLMVALDNPNADYEELTIEIIESVENEINNPRTTRERKEFLYSQRDDFLKLVSRERMKLSTKAWRKIHTKYLVQTDASLYKMGADDNDQPDTGAVAGTIPGFSRIARGLQL